MEIMNAIYEFFFCPIHGILAPANWMFVAPAFVGVRMLYCKIRSKCKL